MTWASYARVSSDGQTGLDKYGLERQDRATEKYIRATGYTGEILKFRDVISGTLEAREHFERLIHAARDRQVARVVIPEPDRLAREVFAGAALVFEMWGAGLEVHNARKGLLDRSSGESRRGFMADLISADHELETITRRMYEGKLEKVRDGKPANVLNGYGWNKGVIDPHELEVLKWIAEQALSRGLPAIAADLNARSEPPPGRAISWGVTTIRAMLRNPMYVGRYEFGRKGERIAVPVPPLLEADLWHAVQAALSNRHKGQRLGSRRDVFHLQSRIRCDVCGGAMSGYQPSKTAHLYYFCRNTLLKYEAKCTHRTYYRAEEIHAAVFAHLTHLETDQAALERSIARPAPKLETGNDRKRLTNELARAERAYLAGVKDLEWFQAQTERVQTAIAKLETIRIDAPPPDLDRARAQLTQGLALATLRDIADATRLTVRVAPGANIKLEIGAV